MEAWLARRPNAAQRGYDGRWRAYRIVFLRRNPWCAYHLQRNLRVPATVVDHKVPHRGNWKLFWLEANHQGLCQHCHDSTKRAEERSGYRRGCDESGQPLDPSHHWNG